MFCGNAVGEMLPPYTVYKSEHLYDSWCCGGPKGSRFNRSKSGWFNEETFEDWFKTTALLCLKKQSGPKVLIGDNLSSHLSEEVVNLCNQHNIKFICLPANSTHLLQPLDVAVFRPLKVYWRRCVSDWKKVNTNHHTIPQSQFPYILSNVVKELAEGNGPANLISGF